MKKKITRWYEKNEHLKAFMDLMENLSIDSQCEIAIDIIIEASELIDRDYSKKTSPHCKEKWRWTAFGKHQRGGGRGRWSKNVTGPY